MIAGSKGHVFHTSMKKHGFETPASYQVLKYKRALIYKIYVI